MRYENLRLGILNADELTQDIEEKFGNYNAMFEALFSNSPFLFNFYQVTKKIFPENINECDAYLITGSKYSVYEDIPWVNLLKEFIVQLNENNHKLIGICFGHQIIAEALGGKVTKSPNGWGVGVMKSDIVNSQSWMESDVSSYSLRVSHEDQVKQLPKDAVCIASNDFCLNSSFQIHQNILTFQGHPEFSREYMLYIMDKRRSVIGEETYVSAKDSLNLDVDGQTIAKWIENFIIN